MSMSYNKDGRGSVPPLAVGHGWIIIVTADPPSFLAGLQDSHVAGVRIIDLLIDTGMPVVFCPDKGIVNDVIDTARTVTTITDIGLGKIIGRNVGYGLEVGEIIGVVAGVAW
jgi:hypothetical protein